MANEAVCIEKSVVNDVMRTCAEAVTIEKGTIVWLDPAAVNTISGASSIGKSFGGITTAEKVALDGSTKVPVALNGVWDLKCAGCNFPVNSGDLCVLSGVNVIAGCVGLAALSGGCIVGKCEEVGSAGDTIRVRLLGY